MAGNDRHADPVRTLTLLWRGHQAAAKPARNARGPKQGLTVDRIVESAIRVADAEGLDALSMRKVAEPLGVSAMSLYTYVHGRAELVNCMLDTVLAEAPSLTDGDGDGDGAADADADADADAAAGPVDWRPALERYARGLRDIAMRHPWMPELFGARMLMGPNETAVWDGVLHAVSGTGLPEREMLAVVNLVNGYVRGATVQEGDSERDRRREGLSHEEWYEQSGPVLENLIPFAKYPTLTRVWMSGVFEENGSGFGADGGFAFGLARVLDGVERFVAEHARDAEPAVGAEPAEGTAGG